MKRVIFSIMLAFCVLNIYSQHISFMGIKLGQPIGVIDRSLQQKGFLRENNYGSQSLFIYSGEFWKFKEARLLVFTNDGIVTAIDVRTTPKLYPGTTFNNLVKSLNDKYGKYDIRKSNDYYIWKMEGGVIEVNYEKEISVLYMDRTNTDYIRKYKNHNEMDDL